MVKGRTLTQADVNFLKEELKKDFPTRIHLENQKEEILEEIDEKLTNLKSDFFEKIDPVLKEVSASREERKVVARKLSEHTNQIEKIQKHLGLPQN